MSRIAPPLALAALIAALGCSVTPRPVVQPLAARTWALPAEMTFSQAVKAFREKATSLGYEVVEGRDGLFLRSERFYSSDIDRYCVYPVINAKTGGRMHTFASWQMEMNRLASVHGRAFGIMEVQVLREEAPLRARTFCRALTELNVQPAESTGVYERELMEQVGATAH